MLEQLRQRNRITSFGQEFFHFELRSVHICMPCQSKICEICKSAFSSSDECPCRTRNDIADAACSFLSLTHAKNAPLNAALKNALSCQEASTRTFASPTSSCPPPRSSIPSRSGAPPPRMIALWFLANFLLGKAIQQDTH